MITQEETIGSINELRNYFKSYFFHDMNKCPDCKTMPVVEVKYSELTEYGRVKKFGGREVCEAIYVFMYCECDQCELRNSMGLEKNERNTIKDLDRLAEMLKQYFKELLPFHPGNAGVNWEGVKYGLILPAIKRGMEGKDNDAV